MSPGGATANDDAEMDPGARPLGRRLSVAFVAGAVAGGAAGLIDGVWSWRGLGQFAPDAASKLRALVFLGASCALAGAALASAIAAVAIGLARGTRLGNFAAAVARSRIGGRGDRDERRAVAALSLALAGIPALAGALGVSYWIAYQALATRKHIGLVIAAPRAIRGTACSARRNTPRP